MISPANNIFFNDVPTNFYDLKEKNTLNNLKIVNNIFNLTRKNFDIHSILSLPERDRNEVINITFRLLKRNVVGFEILDLKDRPYKSYVQTKISSNYSHLKPYRKRVDFFI